MRLRKLLVAAAAIPLCTPIQAQILPSGAQTVQGAGDVNRGYPVNVVLTDGNGNASTTVNGTTVQGNVAAGVADSGNPVKAGGIFTASRPTLTDGQRGDLQLSPRGSLITQPGGAASASADAFGNNVLTGLSHSGVAILPITAPYLFNGTTWDRQRGDVNGAVVQPALSSTFWNYAAATGGIVNTTTAVTIKAAAGAGVRNYICSLNVSQDALGAATELAIRDGAAGTVLWRSKLQTGATQVPQYVFTPCLKGTANTLMEVVTLTAVTGGVYVNASGYTGN